MPVIDVSKDLDALTMTITAERTFDTHLVLCADNLPASRDRVPEQAERHRPPDVVVQHPIVPRPTGRRASGRALQCRPRFAIIVLELEWERHAWIPVR